MKLPQFHRHPDKGENREIKGNHVIKPIPVYRRIHVRNGASHA